MVGSTNEMPVLSKKQEKEGDMTCKQNGACSPRGLRPHASKARTPSHRTAPAARLNGTPAAPAPAPLPPPRLPRRPLRHFPPLLAPGSAASAPTGRDTHPPALAQTRGRRRAGWPACAAAARSAAPPAAPHQPRPPPPGPRSHPLHGCGAGRSGAIERALLSEAVAPSLVLAAVTKAEHAATPPG